MFIVPVTLNCTSSIVFMLVSSCPPPFSMLDLLSLYAAIELMAALLCPFIAVELLLKKEFFNLFKECKFEPLLHLPNSAIDLEDCRAANCHSLIISAIFLYPFCSV